jgi:hypothetical protein
MTASKSTKSAATAAATPPAAGAADSRNGRDTKHLFTRKQTSSTNQVTRERIAEDIDAFRKAGGKIEVLGVTHTLKKLDGAPTLANTQPARPSSGGKRSKG